ncbi:hypothetical protein Gogos_010479, partial [Gossypium gossypioides]|nr:hypothetical protein [Gossypium gossypioides]
PLSQGIANAVGQISFCRETLGSCSLLGHWGLGKLIAFYDDNRISINGDTGIAFTESIDKRFEGIGWHVIWSRMRTLAMMKFAELRLVKTVWCNKSFLLKSFSLLVLHSALGAKQVDATRKNLEWPFEPFHVPEDVKSHRSHYVPQGAAFEAEWDAKFAEYEKKYREETVELKLIITGELPAGWEKALLECNVRFGVREHGIGAICNGIALHSPADGNEISGAYKVVVFKRKTPSILALSKK